MSLFTDGPISTAKDLQQYETSVLSDANAEGIDVVAKVALAQQEVGNELTLFRLRRAPVRGYPVNYQRARDLTDVVVTDALRRWHVHKTLAAVYRDAYHNQLNDRYQSKWTQYEQLARESSRIYFQLGAGVVADPLPQAGMPALSGATGIGAGGTFYVVVTWVNAGGQEGVPSGLAQFSVPVGEFLAVAVEGAPANAVGWNVYVGTSPSGLARQNDTPVATGGNWVVSEGLISGATPPAGQQPDWFIVDHHVIERG
jgi:hypothetical protein